MMDQSGIALPKNGLAENKLMEGVTTAIGGEGGTPVPAEQLRRLLGKPREKRNQPELGQLLFRNAGTHRRARLRFAPADSGRTRQNEIHLDTAMQNGAMGMTTALIYPPSSYATTPELIEMAKVAARVWRHLCQPHARRGQGARAIG